MTVLGMPSTSVAMIAAMTRITTVYIKYLGKVHNATRQGTYVGALLAW